LPGLPITLCRHVGLWDTQGTHLLKFWSDSRVFQPYPRSGVPLTFNGRGAICIMHLAWIHNCRIMSPPVEQKYSEIQLRALPELPRLRTMAHPGTSLRSSADVSSISLSPSAPQRAWVQTQSARCSPSVLDGTENRRIAGFKRLQSAIVPGRRLKVYECSREFPRSDGFHLPSSSPAHADGDQTTACWQRQKPAPLRQ
jgi:hypothetical protein